VSSATYATALRIPHSHPALPGHFPGRPVVPGVVLLDQVLCAAEQWLGDSLRVHSLQLAKFAAPLLPDQDAQIQLKLQGSELRFTITRTGEVIAQGMMNIAVGASA
jgi:3-hydroxyacyl-[acyl-carrier-protein] dehydratase